MKVIIYKLDEPFLDYTWWRKEIEVNNTDDLIKIAGVCGTYVYCETIFNVNEDSKLIQEVSEITKGMQTKSASDVIQYLFNTVNVLIHINKKENK